MTVPVALTIAGTDSSGGAGVSADLATFAALGVWGTCAVTAVTAQNTRGVDRIEPVAPEMVAAQIESVAVDLHPAAAKTGMLVSAAHIHAVLAALDAAGIATLVVDPVLVATSGDALYDAAGDMDALDELMARATVVTPNLAEAARLTGLAAILDRDGMIDAAHLLVHRGAQAVLVTGGHLPGDVAPDCLVRADTDPVWLDGPRLDAPNDHGSGCVLSAAVCAYLARGDAVVDACRQAKTFAAHALHGGLSLGGGVGPVDPHRARRPSMRLGRALSVTGVLLVTGAFLTLAVVNVANDRPSDEDVDTTTRSSTTTEFTGPIPTLADGTPTPYGTPVTEPDGTPVTRRRWHRGHGRAQPRELARLLQTAADVGRREPGADRPGHRRGDRHRHGHERRRRSDHDAQTGVAARAPVHRHTRRRPPPAADWNQRWATEPNPNDPLSVVVCIDDVTPVVGQKVVVSVVADDPDALIYDGPCDVDVRWQGESSRCREFLTVEEGIQPTPLEEHGHQELGFEHIYGKAGTFFVIGQAWSGEDDGQSHPYKSYNSSQIRIVVHA